MVARLRCLTPIACCLIATVGCVAQRLPSEVLQQAVAESGPPEQTPAAVVPHSPYAKRDAQAWAGDTPQPAAGATAPAAPVPPPDLQAIAAELRAMGNVDPQTQQQLLADLGQTDPALWPMLMQTFRAGAAYKNRTTTARADGPPSASKVETETKPVATAAAAPTTETAQSQSPRPEATSPATALPMEMLRSQLGTRNSAGGGGLSLPTETLLSAAVEEAQRNEAQQLAAVLPPAGASVNPPAAPKDSPEMNPSEAMSADAPAPAAKSSSEEWASSLQTSIDALKKLTAEPPHSAEDVARHARLRMLYLAAGRRDEALEPIPGISAAEQDYWREQLYALAVCLDTERQPDPAKRSAEARLHLAKADSRLGETGMLSVRNLAFCSEVSSFGVYERFKEAKFKANQPLILYAEVQNFKSEESEKGFHTALRSSYQILDAQGKRVADADLALTEEYCRNERRDYFIRYFLSVPERIYAGKYTLQLTIVDTLSRKIGQATIDFTVGDE